MLVMRIGLCLVLTAAAFFAVCSAWIGWSSGNPRAGEWWHSLEPKTRLMIIIGHAILFFLFLLLTGAGCFGP